LQFLCDHASRRTLIQRRSCKQIHLKFRDTLIFDIQVSEAQVSKAQVSEAHVSDSSCSDFDATGLLPCVRFVAEPTIEKIDMVIEDWFSVRGTTSM
jgi:hypothetical protein